MISLNINLSFIRIYCPLKVESEILPDRRKPSWQQHILCEKLSQLAALFQWALISCQNCMLPWHLSIIFSRPSKVLSISFLLVFGIYMWWMLHGAMKCQPSSDTLPMMSTFYNKNSAHGHQPKVGRSCGDELWRRWSGTHGMFLKCVQGFMHHGHSQ